MLQLTEVRALCTRKIEKDAFDTKIEKLKDKLVEIDERRAQEFEEAK